MRLLRPRANGSNTRPDPQEQWNERPKHCKFTTVWEKGLPTVSLSLLQWQHLDFWASSIAYRSVAQRIVRCDCTCSSGVRRGRRGSAGDVPSIWIKDLVTSRCSSMT